MFDVVQDISSLSIPDRIARASAIKAGVSGNAAFSTLSADLTALGTLITNLGLRQTAITTAQAAVATAVAARDSVDAQLTAALNAIAMNVGKLALTEADVTSTTMHVKGSGPAKPKTPPNQPTGLELTIGDTEGSISGHCNGQPTMTVDYYEIHATTTDPNAPGTTWPFTETSKKSSFDFDGLPTGQKVWAEIRACNSYGKSPWSDPATVRVP